MIDLAEELKKQLAELHAENERLKDDIAQHKEDYATLEADYKNVNKLGLEPWYIKQVVKENEQLKQQLTDKDKEIGQLKEDPKIAELSKQLAELKEQNDTWEFGADIATHRIAELEQQLAEKDKEIERLKEETRRQVCEEIRELASDCWYFVLDENKDYFDENRYVLAINDFDEILDQIEKGECYE